MSAALFYWRRVLVNWLRSLIKKPSKLIMVLMIVVPLVLLLVISIVLPPSADTKVQPIETLFPIIFLICGLMFGVSWVKGCQTGGTFFRMADVNLLFTAPLKPQRILAFGLINQMTTLLVSTVFIVYQLPNLIRVFQIRPSGIMALIGGYLTLLLISELVSMGLYIFLSTRPRLRPAVTRLPYGMGLLVGLVFLALLLREGRDLGRAWAAFGALPVWRVVPPIGWVSSAIIAVMRRDLTQALLYGGLLVLMPLGILLWINRAKADYYEDVLIATERKEQTLQATREGRSVTPVASTFARFRRDQGGIRHGWGASAFFWRQILILRRRSRFGLINANMIIQIIAGIGMVLLLRSEPDTFRWVFVAVPLFFLFIAVRFNEWPQELRRIWLYVAPSSSGAKMFWATLPGPLKALYDSLPYFLIVTLAGGVSAPAALAAWLLTGTFASFNVSAGMIIGRIFGRVSNIGITAFLVTMLEYFMMSPSILAVVFGTISGHQAILFAAGSLINILIYWICWLIGRDMLHERDE